ncbi:uncharacterized protein Hap1MRO34_021680 isoform 2-T2 [Clarias gariepinus]
MELGFLLSISTISLSIREIRADSPAFVIQQLEQACARVARLPRVQRGFGASPGTSLSPYAVPQTDALQSQSARATQAQ